MKHSTLRTHAWLLLVVVLLVSCGGSKSHQATGTGSLQAPPDLKAVLVTGAANVQITNYVLVGTTQVSSTVFEYTYRADTINGTGAAATITASLASSAAATTVIDGALDFASVDAGATKTSIDTFTIRQDRTFAFNESALTWTVTATPLPARPAISADPQSQTVLAPDIGVFSVTATGTALQYQWQSSSDGGATWSPIPDAITASYTTAATTTAMSGSQYRVIVTNPGGSATSAAATLTVNLAPPAPGADAAGLRIEEVVYLPSAGDVPFIDLVNVGPDVASLKRVLLLVGDVPVRLADAGPTLAPGAHLLVLLDGQDRADGSTYHAPPEATVAADAGTIAILDPFGYAIDRVAWGSAPGAVNEEPSGVQFEPPEAGRSVGRAPGMTGARDRGAWVGYLPGEVSPGVANPYPAVRALHPLSGAIMDRSGALLSWFPVPGAALYRVQVAADTSFTNPVLETETGDAAIDVSTLAAGAYVWRVQAMFGGGATAGFSEASSIALTDGTKVPSGLSPAKTRIQALAVQPAASATSVLLPVPLIDQHKDTKMLLLEESHPADDIPSLPRPNWDPSLSHLWNGDHGHLNEKDNADNANCLLASLAMMNHYFGGNMSQDRIGYEIHKARAQGPEWDLNLAPVPPDKVGTAYTFALGRFLAPHWEPPGDKERLWTLATNLIDVQIPVLAIKTTSPAHAFVIVGYDQVAGKRYLVVNDPWHARQMVYDVDSPYVASWSYAPESGAFKGVIQEASITADSDGDGVVDFDEIERFHTDPNLADSDADDVHDYYDIYASVFDPAQGYHYGPGGNRDDDNDGLPMERDYDSDGGGCNDGREDKDGNGKFAPPGETYNFNDKDDSCLELSGHLQLVIHDRTSIPDFMDATLDDKTDISVRFDPDPDNPGSYIDAGSRYVFRGAHSATYYFPGCTTWADSAGSESGDFMGPNASPATANVVIDGSGRLAVSFAAGIDGNNTQGWVRPACNVPAGSGKAGDSFTASFPGECWGVPVAGASPGNQRWVFSCHTPEYDASGDITAVAPPPP